MSDDTLREDSREPGSGEDAAVEAGAASASAPADASPDGGLTSPTVDYEAKAAEYLEGWQRALAELSNYKKRTERDRALWQETITGDLILDLLPVLDDFDRALESLPTDGEQSEWANGIVLIHRKLRSLFEKLGVQEIAVESQQFDPTLHEAVTHEASDTIESGHIIGVVRKGYRLGERVVRPALVRVAN